MDFIWICLLVLGMARAQAQVCPLNFSSVRYTKLDSCSSEPDSGLEPSECCKNALVYLSRVIAVYTNQTGGSSLFLNETLSQACWKATHSLDLGISYDYCNFAPPRYTAYQLPCNFGTMGELLGNLTTAQVTFNDVLSSCTRPRNDAGCLHNFSTSALELARNLNDSVDNCATSLLVGVISRDIWNESWASFLTQLSVFGILSSPSHKREVVLETSLIFVCSFIAVGGALVLLSFFCRKYASKKESDKIGSSSFEEPKDQGKLLHTELYRFSRKEIWKATRNFSSENYLGSGSAGLVHKGVLPSGQLVAIKHIDKEKKADTFFQEVESLSKVRHPNLVSLLGYCQSFEGYYLVYEFCANGNLWQWLFGDRPPLTWEERLNIALGSARGLFFLHTNVGGAIIHRDVKPTNILLNDNMEAKLSDFGLSKFITMEESHVFTEVKGTSGYLDPEYMSRGQLTLASDIYSFGIVLLQLVSGRKPIDFNLQHRYSLVRAAQRVAERGSDIHKFADPLMDRKFSAAAALKIVEIAVFCTAQSSNDRPTIKEINETLEAAVETSKAGYEPQDSSRTHSSPSRTTLPLPPNRVLPRLTI
ncbi:probable serine/threonine-protein kinase PBL22 [Selaginella moellendorffii]|uniref:probable serine/threonine-protein kinase PBL22 n=1 Tax=Selaginella moellendorffii TaxID=88036 RepID=UPI000D1D10A3|nr:probable serine/threonine-protein kinase PBL22 [Selaginella moellendorffii]|eukprot:XP_024519995.1 probable serine/threonine-protein kinase PBL22 [Selaginella moellendorffii]